MRKSVPQSVGVAAILAEKCIRAAGLDRCADWCRYSRHRWPSADAAATRSFTPSAQPSTKETLPLPHAAASAPDWGLSRHHARQRAVRRAAIIGLTGSCYRHDSAPGAERAAWAEGCKGSRLLRWFAGLAPETCHAIAVQDKVHPDIGAPSPPAARPRRHLRGAAPGARRAPRRSWRTHLSDDRSGVRDPPRYAAPAPRAPALATARGVRGDAGTSGDAGGDRSRGS
jgi:hypothetical protein